MTLVRGEELWETRSDEDLICVGCRTLFETPDELLDYACPDCRNEGFIRRRRRASRRVEERWPAKVGATWVAVPTVLFEAVVPLGLDATDLALLVVLEAHRLDGDGATEVWPSQQRLAARTGSSVATVKRHIKKLADAGLIEITRESRPGGRYAANHYTRRGLDAALSQYVRAQEEVNATPRPGCIVSDEVDQQPEPVPLLSERPRIEDDADEPPPF